VTLPCEYCGRPVANAERFVRLAVWPCCASCRWFPLALGLALLAVFGWGIADLLWSTLR
jgi:hypothetical protein